MMRRQANRAIAAVIVIIALILSQLWISAYACATVQQPVSASPIISTALANPHSDMSDHHASAICNAHCDNTAQPAHADQPSPPPLVWLPVIWGYSAILAFANQPQTPNRLEPSLISAPPPARILFQVFRI